MLRREQIEQFYRDIEQLDLKFPVAAIARQTGHSKANVSKYLGRKLEPSESFLNAFYEKFLNGSKNVSRETNSDIRDDLIAALKRENEFLRQRIDSNLKLLEDRTLVMTQVQKALMALVLLYWKDQKGGHNKSAEILRKYELEGIFL